MVTQLVLNVVATLVVAVAYLRLVGYGRPVFERGTFVEVVRYGVTSHLGNIALQVNARYDQIVMASVLPAYQLSPCLTAVSAAAFIQTLAIAVRSVVVPRIVRTPELSEKRAMLTRFLRGYVAAATALFLLLAVAVPFVIPLVYGDDFRDAIPAAEILLVGGCFVGLKTVLFAGDWQPVARQQSRVAGAGAGADAAADRADGALDQHRRRGDRFRRRVCGSSGDGGG